MDAQGKVEDGGLVLIEMNWFLFLYNISQQVLGTPSGGGGTGLPVAGIISLESLEADAADADAITSRQGISNALIQSPPDIAVQDSDLPSIARALLLAQAQEIQESDLPSIARALLWAQDGFLPDPAPLAQPVKVITVAASPFTYTAPFTGNVAITGGTVSAISIIRQGTTVATGLTAGLMTLSRADQVQVTYSALPTMTFLPL